MTFLDAVKSAASGARITRPMRPGFYLTFSEDVGLVLNSADDETKTPCRWVSTPGDTDADDWIVVSTPAKVSMKPGRIVNPGRIVSEPPSLPRCLFCGGVRLIDGS